MIVFSSDLDPADALARESCNLTSLALLHGYYTRHINAYLDDIGR